MSSVSFGQAESAAAKAAADTFAKNYIGGDYVAIFNAFAPAMQAALPLDKTVEFFTGLQGDAGLITAREFVRYEKGYALYKTQFQRALLGVRIAVNAEGRISGLFVGPYKETSQPEISRNRTILRLPFKDEWTVIWGGDTKELNYHVESEAQKNAFDLVITDSRGATFRGDGKVNEDYYAFGKELLAPCAGEVVLAVDGIRDNVPGVMNPVYVPGNTVIIKTAANEYLFFAHFKQHSIRVKQGDKVRAGQVLGLCGNSGNSSEAHLHFHIQNVEDMNVATGVKCFFEKIIVNGSVKTDYSPIQKEKIRNQD